MSDCSIFKSPHNNKSLYEKNKKLLYVQVLSGSTALFQPANFLEWLGDVINVDLLLAHAALKAG